MLPGEGFSTGPCEVGIAPVLRGKNIACDFRENGSLRSSVEANLMFSEHVSKEHQFSRPWPALVRAFPRICRWRFFVGTGENPSRECACFSRMRGGVR